MLSKHCFHQVSRRALSFGTRSSNLKGVLAATADHVSRLASVSSRQEVSSPSSSLHFYSSVANRHVNTTLTPFIPTVNKNEDVFLKRYLSTTTTTASSASMDQNEKKEEQSGFKKLSPELEQLLRSEFEAFDANHDGKIDSEELKHLLRKHKDVFRESEILEISELFYVGNAAQGVPIDRLLKAIDDTLAGTGKSSLGAGTCAAEYYYDLNHHQWRPEDLENVKQTHVEPTTTSDKIALAAVKVVRFCFDNGSGWNRGEITTSKILTRVIFLETIAAVPGMAAAVIRHFQSLRHMERDGGLINMFLEEATNERMHLLTFITMRDPGIFFRAVVVLGQAGFATGFVLAYMISPKFCHRFVGYVEEEAVHTYTTIIGAIENAEQGSDLGMWQTAKAPKIGISYWHLGENGTVLDLMKAVRADEAEHRDVNHEVCEMNAGDVNKRYDPGARIDGALNKYVKDMMTRAPKEDK